MPRQYTPRLRLVCERCGLAFERRPSRKARFCSKRCAQRSRPRRPWLPLYWSKVAKSEGCWIWTAGKNADGYGYFYREGRLERVHLIAWELACPDSPVPDGWYICHNCPGGDNPACVNPGHLWLGTPAQNAADMAAKGRSTKGRPKPDGFAAGERNAAAKLTEADVREIRRLAGDGVPRMEIARRFGVSYANVNHIVWRLTWKDVE